MDSALARFFGDGREEEEQYILGEDDSINAIPHATCGTRCHQSKTDADVKRENKNMGVVSNTWQENTRKIWHFLHLFWRAILVE